MNAPEKLTPTAPEWRPVAGSWHCAIGGARYVISEHEGGWSACTVLVDAVDDFATEAEALAWLRDQLRANTAAALAACPVAAAGPWEAITDETEWEDGELYLVIDTQWVDDFGPLVTAYDVAVNELRDAYGEAYIVSALSHRAKLRLPGEE